MAEREDSTFVFDSLDGGLLLRQVALRDVSLQQRLIALLQAFEATGQALRVGRTRPEQHADFASREVGTHQLAEVIAGTTGAVVRGGRIRLPIP